MKTASRLLRATLRSSTLGEDVKFCAYSLDTEDLEKAVGACVVASVEFEGSAPAPRLITIVKGWDEIASQEEVSSRSGDLAWSWTADGLGCEEEGCLDGEAIQVRLLGAGFGLYDNEEHCPWTRVQARFELAAP